MSPSALCYQPAVAAILLAGGIDVVLCGTDDTELAAAVVAARAAGGGRIAIFVGEEVLVTEAAVAMAAELFGGSPVIVSSLSEARNLTGLPGSQQT